MSFIGAIAALGMSQCPRIYVHVDDGGDGGAGASRGRGTMFVECPECRGKMVRGRGFCSAVCCRAYRAAGKAKKASGH